MISLHLLWCLEGLLWCWPTGNGGTEGWAPGGGGGAAADTAPAQPSRPPQTEAVGSVSLIFHVLLRLLLHLPRFNPQTTCPEKVLEVRGAWRLVSNELEEVVVRQTRRCHGRRGQPREAASSLCYSKPQVCCCESANLQRTQLRQERLQKGDPAKSC